MSTVEAFHRIVGQLSYPMVIVTASAAGRHSGCLVGFHTQCSIDPPHYLVCISRRNHTAAVARDSSHLGVHLLDQADHELSVLFGEETGDTVDKFACTGWTEVHGVPILNRPKAWFVGHVLGHVDVGDHVAYLLEPVAAEFAAGRFEQLSFPQVKDMDPGHGA